MQYYSYALRLYINGSSNNIKTFCSYFPAWYFYWHMITLGNICCENAIVILALEEPSIKTHGQGYCNILVDFNLLPFLKTIRGI